MREFSNLGIFQVNYGEDLRNHFADVLATTGNIFFNPVIIEDHHIIPRYVEKYVANASENYLLIEPWA
jgi:tetrahydromethanopterin S-methyltransferase subunit H